MLSAAMGFTVAGLFAGVGGFEIGLAAHGGRAVLLAENWPPARAVLAERFPAVPLAGDVREIDDLPDVDVIAAGFPCVSLSAVGPKVGMPQDSPSGLVREVLRLADRTATVVVENVRNLVHLHKGRWLSWLTERFEDLGYRWAYRVVDSRCVGVPQRRQRVFLVASREVDPARVLFADEAGPPPTDDGLRPLWGFSWTEGLRGLGWTQDAVPTLKGGSALGIPSPPAIWHPSEPDPTRRVVVPRIEDAEALQGLGRGWTAAGGTRARWKLVGNAVTPGVAAWIASRLVGPGTPVCPVLGRITGTRWPLAAMGGPGEPPVAVAASPWPVRLPYRHLDEVVDLAVVPSLSPRAASGFLGRARRSRLRFAPGFLADVAVVAGEAVPT
jgi:DNA (cytosine-5)-methyltransferase 1